MDAPALLPGLILQHLQGGRDKVQLFTLAFKISVLLALKKKTRTAAWNETSPVYLGLCSLPNQLEGHLPLPGSFHSTPIKRDHIFLQHSFRQLSWLLEPLTVSASCWRYHNLPDWPLKAGPNLITSRSRV